MTQHDDRPYLGQMLDAALEAHGYVDRVSYHEFAADRLRQRAVIYVIQIVGEAARRVSLTTRHEHNDIPWHEIIGMRHRLVHEYLGIEIDEVWRAATQDLPPLISSLRRILEQSGTEPKPVGL